MMTAAAAAAAAPASVLFPPLGEVKTDRWRRSSVLRTGVLIGCWQVVATAYTTPRGRATIKEAVPIGWRLRESRRRRANIGRESTRELKDFKMDE